MNGKVILATAECIIKQRSVCWLMGADYITPVSAKEIVGLTNGKQSPAQKMARKVLASVADKAAELNIEGFGVDLLGPGYMADARAEYWGIRAGIRTEDNWIDIYCVDDEGPLHWEYEITREMDMVAAGVLWPSEDLNKHKLDALLFGVRGIN